MTTFTPGERSRLKRFHDRGHYDYATIHAILDAGLIAHVGYLIDGRPFVTPTAYWRDGNRLFWHGSAASRMLRNQEDGAPVCVTVTHLDGIVLARSGFNSSINYRSVMAFGTARLLEDRAEIDRQLDRLMERVAPGRAATLRPNHPQELKATSVIVMEIEEASAKIGAGPPEDDAPDYALDCWAGVVPVVQVLGTIEPDPRLRPGIAEPAHLAPFRAGRPLEQVLTENAKTLEHAEIA
jgi:nitroimidazol reductase NimA-like FMN-containing flavoprotein (pyridoxamine 5'-phosphate oxidase superfamily)